MAAYTSHPETGATAGSSARGALEQEVVALFDCLRDRLLRYIIAIGVSAPDGEEVIQETFLALFQHLQAGKSRQNLQGWLFRVAHNLALKRCRGAKRRAQVVRNTGPLESEAFDPSPNPEVQCAAGQAQRSLLAVMEALPELDRRCLMLRAEGLRYREIAGVLDISLGAVSLSLSRSLARMTRVVQR
jgi:RNA polymerase sigma-70 factor (ECF subfamily)